MSKIVRHTANGVEWLLVGVPNGSEYYNLYNASGDRHIIFIVSPKGILDIDLPNGKYEAQFQFLVSQATEAEADFVVKSQVIDTGYGDFSTGYWNYENAPTDFRRIKPGQVFEDDPVSSLQSLTRSHGFTEDVAVIKIIN